MLTIIFEYVVITAYGLILFLTLFWAWIHTRKWWATNQLSDLSYALLMLSMTVVLGSNGINSVFPDPSRIIEAKFITESGLIGVALAWCLHTFIYVRTSLSCHR